MAPTGWEGSADSQVPVEGRPLPAFLGMVGFICVSSAIRDRRSLTHEESCMTKLHRGGLELASGWKRTRESLLLPLPHALLSALFLCL